MGQPLVELVDIRKRYGTGEAAFEALRGVSFSIDEGEFVAIMGASGSGKSTAMNIIGALDSPTAGAYLFSGMHVESLSRDQRALLRRKYLGFVFQGFNLLARTTALENVERLRAPQAGAGRARPRRPAGLGAPYAGGALGRTAAARRDCARHRHAPEAASRRRADGQS